MPGMTDRDHFAAAALTGLLYPDVDDEFAMSYIVGRAYLWADAMLRERCRGGGDCPGSDNAPNLDAAPAVKAGTPGTGDTPKPIKGDVSDRSKPITGPDPDSRVWETHTPATHATPGEGSEQRECTEPVAWGVEQPDGEFAVLAFNRQRAEDYATASDRVVPLYRRPQPALTDAERDLLAWLAAGVDDMRNTHQTLTPAARATIRGLLERLGGER